MSQEKPVEYLEFVAEDKDKDYIYVDQQKLCFTLSSVKEVETKRIDKAKEGKSKPIISRITPSPRILPAVLIKR